MKRGEITGRGNREDKNKNQGKYNAEVKLQPTEAPEGKNKENER